MALSPQQRQLLMFGAPVVAVFALISVLSKRNAPAEANATASGPPVGYTLPVAPSTDAIGVGQLSQWEDLIGARIEELGAALNEQVAAIPAPTDNSGALLAAIQQLQTTQQPASSGGNCTPKFPWHWSGGVLVDNYSGRPAYFGRESQPAGAYTPGQPVPQGHLTWQMPDGRWSHYDPNNWYFGDPSRPPICH